MKKTFLILMATLASIALTITFILLSSSWQKERLQIFSRPSGGISRQLASLDQDLVPLLIFSNHGLKKGLYPKRELAPPNAPPGFPQTLKVGGVEILSHYLQLIKSQFEDNVLILDAGDTFSTNEDAHKLELKLKVMEQLPFDAVLFSGEDYLSQALSQRQTGDLIPFLNSNILDLRTGRPIRQRNLLSSRIVERAGLKIGLIGLIDIQSLSQKQQKQLNGVYFQDLVAAFLKLKKDLHSRGAQVLILLGHIPGQCQSRPLFESKRGNHIPPLQCPPRDPLKQFVERLPANSLDLIILSGGRPFSGRIGELLILNGPSDGHYLGQASLFYHRGQKRIVFERGQLHPLIKTCHQFFASTLDCYIQRHNSERYKGRQKIMRASAYSLVPARFLGLEIRPDSSISAILNGANTK